MRPERASPARAHGCLLAAALVIVTPFQHALADGTAAPTPSPPVDEVIGILDVRAEGISETASDLLTKEISSAVSGSGYIPVMPERLREVMVTTPWNGACLVGPCLAELDHAADVGLVLEAYLVSVGDNFDYVVTLLDTRDGVPIGQLQRTCDVCTLQEALTATAAAAVELVVKSAGRPTDPRTIGPVLPPERPFAIPQRPHRPPNRWRRAGLLLLGSAIVVGGTGFAMHDGDHVQLGAGALGAAATLAVAGGFCVVVSF